MKIKSLLFPVIFIIMLFLLSSCTNEDDLLNNIDENALELGSAVPIENDSIIQLHEGEFS